MNFIADNIVKGSPYPALARHQARPYTPSWREFGQHWPHTTPAELLRQAEALFAQADAALAKSPPDFATYQTKLSQARGLVQQALAAVKG